MADRLTDPVIGWPAVARYLSELRCAALGVTPASRAARQLAITASHAGRLVRESGTVAVRYSGALVVVSAVDLDMLAGQCWPVANQRPPRR